MVNNLCMKYVIFQHKHSRALISLYFRARTYMYVHKCILCFRYFLSIDTHCVRANTDELMRDSFCMKFRLYWHISLVSKQLFGKQLHTTVWFWNFILPFKTTWNVYTCKQDNSKENHSDYISKQFDFSITLTHCIRRRAASAAVKRCLKIGSSMEILYKIN